MLYTEDINGQIAGSWGSLRDELKIAIEQDSNQMTSSVNLAINKWCETGGLEEPVDLASVIECAKKGNYITLASGQKVCMVAVLRDSCGLVVPESGQELSDSVVHVIIRTPQNIQEVTTDIGTQYRVYALSPVARLRHEVEVLSELGRRLSTVHWDDNMISDEFVAKHGPRKGPRSGTNKEHCRTRTE